MGGQSIDSLAERWRSWLCPSLHGLHALRWRGMGVALSSSLTRLRERACVLVGSFGADRLFAALAGWRSRLWRRGWQRLHRLVSLYVLALVDGNGALSETIAAHKQLQCARGC